MSIYKSDGPYNQYELYEDVIYRLTCCYASLRDNATYPMFNVFNNMESLHRTIEDAEHRGKMLSDYSEIRNALGGSGASAAVAKAMIELI